jgi:hypothetical protein
MPVKMFWKTHPVFNPLGIGDHLNELHAEHDSRPDAERSHIMRRVYLREALLAISGQKFLQRAQIPASARRVLWYYDWTTLGDPIMDLSQRFALPCHITLDLCMPRGPAEIFEGDNRFAHVYRKGSDCPHDYDFIILHSIGPAALRFKLRHPATPFAAMIGHQQGERFARTEFSAIRLGQLLGRPIDPMFRPRISREPATANQPGSVVVVIGSKDSRRNYNQWPALLERIASAWDTSWPPLRFTLTGAGKNAHRDLAAFRPEFLARHCDVQLDQPSLTQAVQTIDRGELFLGPDGGLMHVAEALSKPGLCLFSRLLPEWRLLPGSRLQTLYTDDVMDAIPQEQILERFLAVAHQRYGAPAQRIAVG